MRKFFKYVEKVAFDVVKRFAINSVLSKIKAAETSRSCLGVAVSPS